MYGCCCNVPCDGVAAVKFVLNFVPSSVLHFPVSLPLGFSHFFHERDESLGMGDLGGFDYIRGRLAVLRLIIW